MSRHRTAGDPPTYPEALVMLHIDPVGTPQAELIRRLIDKMGSGDLPNYVNRLVQKGHVRITGMAKRRQAPPSRIVALTEQGRRTVAELKRRRVS